MKRRRSRIAALTALALLTAGTVAGAAAAAPDEDSSAPCAPTTTISVWRGPDKSFVATFHDGDTGVGVRMRREGGVRTMDVCFTSTTILNDR
ncbi:hypothetical protein [Streptomyces luteireticuli]|uniref:Uncharacterized protein n=1 Tax=Streptomyces luteireticuli TaxID=173858 RepID=A0ABP3IRM7_9ACTN